MKNIKEGEGEQKEDEENAGRSSAVKRGWSK